MGVSAPPATPLRHTVPPGAGGMALLRHAVAAQAAGGARLGEGDDRGEGEGEGAGEV